MKTSESRGFKSSWNSFLKSTGMSALLEPAIVNRFLSGYFSVNDISKTQITLEKIKLPEYKPILEMTVLLTRCKLGQSRRCSLMLRFIWYYKVELIMEFWGCQMLIMAFETFTCAQSILKIYKLNINEIVAKWMILNIFS